MNKVAAFFNNRDLMNRILFTFVIFLVFRIGSAITVPGVTLNENIWADTTSSFALLNMMGGGALQNFSLLALGVSPYITASIIVQLLSMDVLPSLSQMTKEGDTGRRKLNTITRIVSLVLAAVQAYGIIVALTNSDGITIADTSAWGYTKIIIFMIAGTLLLNWLGDQITDKGIGNGISMLIFAGIISSLPSQVMTAFSELLGSKVNTGDAAMILEGSVDIAIYILAFILIIVFVTFIERSERRLPVSHSNTSHNAESQSSSFLPIKVNASSVMPVIFASSIMVAPSILISLFSNGNPPGWALVIEDVFNFQKMTSMTETFAFPWGPIIYALLIIGFSFFYAQLQINPERIAENFQTSGTYITGIKPGTETERYISRILNRITLMGSFALCAIAILPIILSLSGLVPSSISLGGTGIIILVGVSLEVGNQISGIMAGQGYVERGEI